MGYACPVCDDPQVDARHLANHLAFTAILGDEAHEAWLDDHAPDWADDGEQELAAKVREFADEEEYPQVFEDTTGGRPDRDAGRSGELFDSEGHAHDHSHDHGHDQQLPPQADMEMDEDTEAVLEEARELTKEMLAESEAADDDEPDDEDES